MKCKGCASCTRLIRVANTLENSVGDLYIFYCKTCGEAVYMGSKNLVDVNSETYRLVVEKYKELYGDSIV